MSAVICRRSVAFWLAGPLAVMVAVAAVGTFFGDGILTGPAVAVGNARGTALVMLVLGLPALGASVVAALRGSVRAVLVWAGVVLYILYNSVMFLFATPFNHLFLVYVAMLSLSIWSVVFLARDVDREALARRVSRRLPVRGIGAYLLAIAVLNALIWLRTAVPESFAAEPTSFLREIGLTTDPVFIQDLAFWLPLTALAGVLLWRRRPWGYPTAGAMVVYGVFEGVGVACDQWFGYRADPGTAFASLGGVWLFAGVAVVASTVAAVFLANVTRARPGRGSVPATPAVRRAGGTSATRSPAGAGPGPG